MTGNKLVILLSLLGLVDSLPCDALTLPRCRWVSLSKSLWYLATRETISSYILHFLYMVMAKSGSFTVIYSLGAQAHSNASVNDVTSPPASLHPTQLQPCPGRTTRRHGWYGLHGRTLLRQSPSVMPPSAAAGHSCSLHPLLSTQVMTWREPLGFYDLFSSWPPT